jgi:hypothetical protein
MADARETRFKRLLLAKIQARLEAHRNGSAILKPHMVTLFESAVATQSRDLKALGVNL